MKKYWSRFSNKDSVSYFENRITPHFIIKKIKRAFTTLLYSFIHSFIHSFYIFSHTKAINVYMLTCSEAVPQRCSHKQVLKKMRGKPTREHPCRGMISIELPHSSIKITFPHGWICRSSQNTPPPPPPYKIPSVRLIRNALQQI